MKTLHLMLIPTAAAAILAACASEPVPQQELTPPLLVTCPKHEDGTAQVGEGGCAVKAGPHGRVARFTKGGQVLVIKNLGDGRDSGASCFISGDTVPARPADGSDVPAFTLTPGSETQAKAPVKEGDQITIKATTDGICYVDVLATDSQILPSHN